MEDDEGSSGQLPRPFRPKQADIERAIGSDTKATISLFINSAEMLLALALRYTHNVHGVARPS